MENLSQNNIGKEGKQFERELAEKLEKLEFIARYDKALFWATYSGAKKASIISLSVRPNDGGEAVRIFEDNIKRFDQFLSESGIHYHVNREDVKVEGEVAIHECEFDMSNNEEALSELVSTSTYDGPDRYTKLGLALGFPDSSVRAFSRDGETLNDLPESEKYKEYANFLWFAPSKDNVAEEMKTVEKWAEAVKQSDPELYEKMTSSRYKLNEGIKQDPELLKKVLESEEYMHLIEMTDKALYDELIKYGKPLC